LSGVRKIERIVLGDQVYEAMKERILDQAYAPGEKLNVDALGRELSVSSTPIREALARLVSEGLVRTEPFIGFATAPLPDRSYYDDVYSFRSVIEPWAAAEAARRKPGSDVIDALRAQIAAMMDGAPSRQYRSHRGFTEGDDRFHRIILQAAGNQVALKSYNDLRFHLHISRLYLTREQDVGLTHQEHARIVDALAAGDPDAAARAMQRHLEGSYERLIQ